MAERNKRFSFSTSKRPAPKRGPFNSDNWNDTIDELINDLSSIQYEWNNKLITLLETVPAGEEQSTVDAWKTGLDGRTLYVDSSVTNTSADTTYYNATLDRPVTVEEALDAVYTEIQDAIDTLNLSISTASAGLTTTQKNDIGAHIFDSVAISSATSLDGKSENSRLNIIQLAKDLYGTTYYSLGNDGVADLTNSVRAMVDALLVLHNGSWSGDVAVDHSGLSLTLAQASVLQSSSYNDSYGGSPTNLENDLNQIRTTIKTSKGTTTWTTAQSALYSGGADSLEELLTTTKGSATKTSTNPWGYSYTDINGLTAILNAVRDYTGMGSLTDTSPLYSGQHFITNGQPLEFAASKLDEELYALDEELYALDEELYALDEELYDHILDGHVSLPSTEHWADSIEVETGTRVVSADLQDLIEWQCTPGSMVLSQQFRRHEEGFSGTSKTITHNRGSYPQVQLIQIDPVVTLSGECQYVVNHTSPNSFTIIVQSGVVVSGIALALW